MVRGKVLSVQSHVVSGYVGNKTAALILQVKGFDTDIINTVSLSNHTGYKVVNGQACEGGQLREWHEGLKHNGLARYDYIVSGYMKLASFAKEFKKVVKDLKEISSSVYVLDPVLGDNGHIYTSLELVKVYQEELLPLADYITPNQFEAELLSGYKLQASEDIPKVVTELHKKGPKVVIITSAELTCYPDDILVTIIGEKITTEENKTVIKINLLKYRKMEQKFIGTGDIFTALFTTYIQRKMNTLECVRKALIAMQHLLAVSVKAPENVEIPESKWRKCIEMSVVDCIRNFIDDSFDHFDIIDETSCEVEI